MSKLSPTHQPDFHEIIGLILEARSRAFQAVNTELIGLYWRVGEYISRKIQAAEWGEGVVNELADYIARNYPDLKGFTRRNIYRMRQFYETYADNQKVSALLTQLPWTHNLSIISRCQSMDEREFYLRMAMKEKWSSRELDRQIKVSLFERTLSDSAKEFVSPPLTQIHPSAPEVFRDRYMMEFLNLPEPYEESDLQLGLVQNLKSFLLELGREFCFVGEHYRLQVGMKDFYLDLLFFHRGLRCLVAFELKVEDFQPAHLGQLNFYLEALDREVKLPEENPSVGILLCKSRDQDVVEYAMNRTLSPALVAEYQTRLPEKKLLEERLGLIDSAPKKNQ